MEISMLPSRSLAFLTLGASLVLAGLAGAADEKSDPKAAAKVKLQVKSYEGILEVVKSHKGKVVVMDAWATWCPPCVKEFPNLVKLHKKYGGEKLACVSLSLDNDGLGEFKEHQARVQKFLEEQGATFDNLMSNEDSDTLFKKFDLGSVPAVFVYDKEGKLVKVFSSEKAYEEVLPLVEKLVGGK
jgi:thiol-disulfide isomerase/thioredoxin